jgi:hypothetical protein
MDAIEEAAGLVLLSTPLIGVQTVVETRIDARPTN